MSLEEERKARRVRRVWMEIENGSEHPTIVVTTLPEATTYKEKQRLVAKIAKAFGVSVKLIK